MPVRVFTIATSASTRGLTGIDVVADYVLQRALTVATGEQKKLLVVQVRSHLTNMKRYSSNYTKHLVASKYVVPPSLSY